MIIDGASATTTTDSQAASDAEQLDDDLNRFLTLLVTQLQNQDPLDPMDANEFTAQLVQFASVEQQIYQNANLEQLLAVERNNQAAAMVSYLGTLAEVSGNTLPLENGYAEASYTLAETAAETTIVVRDASGNVVLTQAGATDTGRHAFTWDGCDASGQTVADGAYTLEVVAQRSDEAFVEVAQTVYGRITGAAVEDGTVKLFMGDIAVPMDDVLSVAEAPDAAPSDDE